MAETPQEAVIVRRCQAVVVRTLTDGCDDAEIAGVVDGLSRLPVDHPERARIAAGLLLALFGGGNEVTHAPVRHLEGLLRIADTDPPVGPRWARVRSFARVQAMAYAGMNGELSDVGAVESELSALTEVMGDNPAARPLIDVTRMMSDFMRASTDGDVSAMTRLQAELAERVDRSGDGDHPELASFTGLLSVAVQAMTAADRGDHTEMLEHFEALQEAVRHRADGDLLKQVMATTSVQLRPLQQMLGAADPNGVVQSTDEELEELVALTNRPDVTDFDRAMSHLALGGAYLKGGQQTDLSRIDAAIDSYRRALSLIPVERTQHAFCLQSVALGLLRRSEVAGNTDGLDEAARLLEQALDRLGGPHHPEWVLANELLATIRHRGGSIREAGEIGLLAQRGYAWRALLESDAAGAKVAIRDAARGAVNLARRCLQADNLADALRALDTGRGLMLFAATELRKVPARLDAAGHGDLARRWEAEEQPSPGLRREVLAALVERPDETDDLLDPPSLDEMKSALAELDADALVYLVPGDAPLPGLAVIAPVDGPPAWMALPHLMIDGDVEVEHYLTALADRSRDLVASPDQPRDLAAPPADDQFSGSLATLCDWAWRAAIGPLLEGYVATRPRADGEVPRLVLIPMGDLARIPWQAARRGDGTYAVELAAFSQAVSARLLCENAARRPVALSSAGLVVGDPDTGGVARNLDAARLEAHAVRQAFYQGARYLGRRPNGTVSPSGRGTAAEVRHWLADPGPAAGAAIHLACHGSFETGPDDVKSVLLLAPAEPDGAGAGEVTAEEILDMLAATPGRHVGLVVLAACHTGRSVHGYDEAYSLGTAFLAGSARSVLSTQWSIPDAPTSSLMYLFHHYCRREGLPPWQALRQAQMWMLDPRRLAPEGMPAELLLSVPAGVPAPVAAWAGFVHYGR